MPKMDISPGGDGHNRPELLDHRLGRRDHLRPRKLRTPWNLAQSIIQSVTSASISTSGLKVGQPISGSGVPAGATIATFSAMPVPMLPQLFLLSKAQFRV